jgi:TIR domain
MGVIGNIKKSIFGYDIFISYSRFDSLDYAYAIAQYFMKKGYECYIDQLSSVSPGKSLPQNIKDAVRRSTAFVFVGSEGAQLSGPIANEIELFLKNNKNKPLIPISIDGSISNRAIWYEKIFGLALIDDSSANLDSGSPAKDVFDRIENALKFTKKGVRLRKISLGILLGVIAISGFAAFYSNIKTKEASKAITEKNQADSLANLFRVKKDTAIKQMSLANKLKIRADSLREAATADRSVALREKDSADSLKYISEKIAQANTLASTASSLLESDPTKSFSIASKAIRIYKTPEVCNVLFFAFISAPFYHSIPCEVAKVFPNGKYIAVLFADSLLHVIDWNGNEVYPAFKIHDGWNREIIDFSVSNDNEAIIVFHKILWGRASKIHFLKTGKEIQLYDYVGEQGAKILCISKDARKFLTIAENKIEIYTQNEGDFKNTATLKIPESDIDDGVFSLDNNMVVLWDNSKILFLDISKQMIIDSITNQRGIIDVNLSKSLPASNTNINFLNFTSAGGSYIQFLLPSIGSIRELPSILSTVYYSASDEEMIISENHNSNPILRSTHDRHIDFTLFGGLQQISLVLHFRKELITQ